MKRGLGFALSCALLVACAGSGSVPNAPHDNGAWLGRSSSGTPLPEPPVVHAVHGLAKLTLVAKENPANGQPTFWYQGRSAVIPTIDVNPGNTIQLTMTNDLPAEPPPVMSLQEYMNLHFHGLGVSPRKPSDDVLTMLAAPGQTLHYALHIPPNQEPGLYWYHPHVHGLTNFDVGESGMSGAIVIEGLEKHLPRLAKMKQRIIIVRATGNIGGLRPGADGMPMPAETARPQNTNPQPCVTKDGLTVTLNGVSEPEIPIAPGEKQFFRVVNATGHKTLELAVPGERLVLVALDGFALDNYPGTPATETLATIVLPPASRAEFIVTGPKDGHGALRTLCYNAGPNGDPDPPLLLAHLDAPRDSEGGYFGPMPRAAGAPLPRNVYTTQLPPPAAKRLVVFSESQAPEFYINGKQFSMTSKPMFVVHVGTVELWHVVNVTQEIHDFHIHQLHFVVEKINGVAVEHPFWADSFVLPHRYQVGTRSVPGTLDLLMDFRDPVIRGEFVFHCHILDHEDLGMMAKIEAI